MPPIYTGDMAEQVRAELRRRFSAMRGSARPQATYRFTGLLMCNSCKCSLSIYRDKRIRADGSRYMAWLCYSRWTPYPRSERCDQGRMIADNKVQQVVNNLLSSMIDEKKPDLGLLFDRKGPRSNEEPQRSSLEYEIAEVERLIGELIIQQASAPRVTQDIYTTKIAEAAERLEILQAQRKRLRKSAESPSIIAARDRAFDELLRTGLDDFWLQETTKINQVLHGIFGKYRLKVDQAEIVGIDISPRGF